MNYERMQNLGFTYAIGGGSQSALREGFET